MKKIFFLLFLFTIYAVFAENTSKTVDENYANAKLFNLVNQNLNGYQLVQANQEQNNSSNKQVKSNFEFHHSIRINPLMILGKVLDGVFPVGLTYELGLGKLFSIGLFGYYSYGFGRDLISTLIMDKNLSRSIDWGIGLEGRWYMNGKSMGALNGPFIALKTGLIGIQWLEDNGTATVRGETINPVSKYSLDSLAWDNTLLFGRQWVLGFFAFDLFGGLGYELRNITESIDGVKKVYKKDTLLNFGLHYAFGIELGAAF